MKNHTHKHTLTSPERQRERESEQFLNRLHVFSPAFEMGRNFCIHSSVSVLHISLYRSIFLFAIVFPVFFIFMLLVVALWINLHMCALVWLTQNSHSIALAINQIRIYWLLFCDAFFELFFFVFGFFFLPFGIIMFDCVMYVRVCVSFSIFRNMLDVYSINFSIAMNDGIIRYFFFPRMILSIRFVNSFFFILLIIIII